MTLPPSSSEGPRPSGCTRAAYVPAEVCSALLHFLKSPTAYIGDLHHRDENCATMVVRRLPHSRHQTVSNRRLATGRDMLWSPTIRAALIAGTPWLDVFCPGCGTSRAIDLRTLDRHPLASVGTLVLGLRCSWCPGSAPMPKLLGLYALPPAGVAIAAK